VQTSPDTPSDLLARVARRAAVLAGVGVLAVAAVACGGGGSDETNTASGPSSTSSTTAKPAPTTTAARKPCTPANLDAAAQAQYPGARTQDVACSAAYAVATISGSGVPGGTGVAYFGTQEDGSWVVLKVGPVTVDLVADTPPGVPASLPVGWRSKYDLRLRQESEPQQAQQADGDYLPYVDPPTTPPPPPPPPPEELPPPALPPEELPPQE
jgi:hypothetical protein